MMKVLYDGNGSNIIHVVGLGLYVPAEQHNGAMEQWERMRVERDALKAERDALAAMVQAFNVISDLLDEVEYFAKRNPNSLPQCVKELVDCWEGIIQNTPQQCLLEIQAEAGRKGFMAASLYGFDRMEQNEIVDAANEYAARVRQGESGTWLKDSNVNGGKRQGGE